jgi:hypothetical protein
MNLSKPHPEDFDILGFTIKDRLKPYSKKLANWMKLVTEKILEIDMGMYDFMYHVLHGYYKAIKEPFPCELSTMSPSEQLKSIMKDWNWINQMILLRMTDKDDIDEVQATKKREITEEMNEFMKERFGELNWRIDTFKGNLRSLIKRVEDSKGLIIHALNRIK